MSAAARGKAAWEARQVASMSGCTNHFAGEAITLDGADESSILGSSFDEGGPVLDGADASSTSGSGEDGPVIDVFSGDEEDIQVVISVSLIRPKYVCNMKLGVFCS
jgi:hypothetical protein